MRFRIALIQPDLEFLATPARPREEGLDLHWFVSLDDTREKI